jgi:hypothetical protein
LIRRARARILAAEGEEKAKMRAALESLLRARKLDVTLAAVGAPAGTLPPDRAAATGIAALDDALGGGLRRGHLSEIAATASTGRTRLMMQMLAAATARGEAVALVDTSDAFDPAAADAHGVALPQLLWVRRPMGPDADASRALKACSLILQAGGFGLVVFDLADVAPAALRRFPTTTWMRLARMVEGSDTVVLLLVAERLARSAGGVTIALEAAAVAWQGRSDRARLLSGIAAAPRVVGRL